MQLCHAGGVVMKRGRVIGLSDEGVPHGGGGSGLALEPWGLSVGGSGSEDESGGRTQQAEKQGAAESLSERHGVTVLSETRIDRSR